MGVTGLLQCLKEIQDPTSLERYRNKTLAIDAYGWLHRASTSCAQELCNDAPTRKFISSVMKKVDMLKHFGVTPYFVFDGAPLPAKANTVKERRDRRNEAREKATRLVNSGNKRMAWKEYMKAAYVTPEMVKSVMIELDKYNIRYIVAPYEADPQMVYLEKIGLVDGILSEDSDLLIFGCNKLITKLKDNASCIEICRENFSKIEKIPHLNKLTQEQLRLVAMISGCDYTKGINSIGLKTAFGLVARCVTLDKVLLTLQADGKTIGDEFHDEVEMADLAFQFQKVFDPVTQQLTTLNEYPPSFKQDFHKLELCCGRTIHSTTQSKICNGILNPNSHAELVSREQVLAFKNQSFGGFSSQQQLQLTTKSAAVSTKLSIDFYFSSKSSDDASRRNPSAPALPVDNSRKLNISPVSKRIKKLIPEKVDTMSSKFFMKKSEVSTISSGTEAKIGPPIEIELVDESEMSEVLSFPIKQRNTAVAIQPGPEYKQRNLFDPIPSDGFEVCGNEDDIEESPEKSSCSRYKQLSHDLRVRFGFGAGQDTARKPFQSLGTNVMNKNTAFKTSSKSNNNISLATSRVLKSTRPRSDLMRFHCKDEKMN